MNSKEKGITSAAFNSILNNLERERISLINRASQIKTISASSDAYTAPNHDAVKSLKFLKAKIAELDDVVVCTKTAAALFRRFI